MHTHGVTAQNQSNPFDMYIYTDTQTHTHTKCIYIYIQNVKCIYL